MIITTDGVCVCVCFFFILSTSLIHHNIPLWCCCVLLESRYLLFFPSAVWPPPRTVFYRGAKPLFDGWRDGISAHHKFCNVNVKFRCVKISVCKACIWPLSVILSSLSSPSGIVQGVKFFGSLACVLNFFSFLSYIALFYYVHFLQFYVSKTKCARTQ